MQLSRVVSSFKEHWHIIQAAIGYKILTNYESLSKNASFLLLFLLVLIVWKYFGRPMFLPWSITRFTNVYIWKSQWCERYPSSNRTQWSKLLFTDVGLPMLTFISSEKSEQKSTFCCENSWACGMASSPRNFLPKIGKFLWLDGTLMVLEAKKVEKKMTPHPSNPSKKTPLHSPRN